MKITSPQPLVEAKEVTNFQSLLELCLRCIDTKNTTAQQGAQGQ